VLTKAKPSGQTTGYSEEAVCSSEAEVRHQIRQTLTHEIGHYFGMTKEQLKDV